MPSPSVSAAINVAPATCATRSSAGSAAEAGRADEGERLVAGPGRIGIDQREVDQVGLVGAEIDDPRGETCPGSEVALAEQEHVAAVSAFEHVEARAAIQHVVAGAPSSASSPSAPARTLSAVLPVSACPVAAVPVRFSTLMPSV